MHELARLGKEIAAVARRAWMVGCNTRREQSKMRATATLNAWQLAHGQWRATRRPVRARTAPAVNGARNRHPGAPSEGESIEDIRKNRNARKRARRARRA